MFIVADRENHLLRQVIITTSTVSTLAGQAGLFGITNGEGTNALFNNPSSISYSLDGSYALIVDWYNNLIRKIIITTAMVTTFAGGGSSGYSSGSTNGEGTNALFHAPYGICISPDGLTAVIAENWNHMIRMIIITTSVVSTLAGQTTSGSDNGIGTLAKFNSPLGVDYYPDGSAILVADLSNQLIRKIIISTALVSTLAGTTATSGSTNGFGTNAQLNGPFDVRISPDGSYALVADTNNHMIRSIILSTLFVNTIIGTTTSGSANGVGTNALLRNPAGVAIAPNGEDFIISDAANHVLRYAAYVNEPTLMPSHPPTTSPTFAPSSSPTFGPTSSPTGQPTSFPSFQPTSQHYTLTCPPYSAQFTSNATQNTILCSFWVCPYESVSVSLCDTCNSTNTFIRLLDSSDVEIAFNDKGGSFDCGSCSSLSLIYNQSTVRCDKLTLHQGCRNSESCVGESRITIEATSDEVVKYSFGVIFGDTTILESNRGLLLDYHLNAARGKIRPVSYLVDPSVIMNETNTYPSSDWILIKWRAVHVDRYSNTISTRGDWEDSTLIPSGILTTWIVSSTTSNILGFIVQDLNSTNHHIYFVDNIPNHSPRKLVDTGNGIDLNGRPAPRLLSINNPGIEITDETLTIQSIRQYIKKVSDQRVYLLDSHLDVGVVTFS